MWAIRHPSAPRRSTIVSADRLSTGPLNWSVVRRSLATQALSALACAERRDLTLGRAAEKAASADRWCSAYSGFDLSAPPPSKINTSSDRRASAASVSPCWSAAWKASRTLAAAGAVQFRGVEVRNPHLYPGAGGGVDFHAETIAVANASPARATGLHKGRLGRREEQGSPTQIRSPLIGAGWRTADRATSRPGGEGRPDGGVLRGGAEKERPP